jgi:hypothetical protein
VCLAVLLGVSQTRLFSADWSGRARLRSGNPELALLLADADQVSATFHGLVQDLGRTNGLVYVETGQCGHHVRACVPHVMTRAGEFRLLRILIDPRYARTIGRVQLIGSIAHELHHALEFLADPKVTSGAAMFAFYRREAPRSGVFENEDAVLVGARVAGEMETGVDRARSARR